MLATGRCQSSFNLAVNLIKSFLLVGEKKVQHKQFPCSFSALVAFAASFPSPNSAVKSEVLKAEALKGYVYSSVSSCVWNIRLGIKKKLSHIRINARTKGKNENLWKRNQNSLVILSCIFIAKKNALLHSVFSFRHRISTGSTTTAMAIFLCDQWIIRYARCKCSILYRNLQRVMQIACAINTSS